MPEAISASGLGPQTSSCARSSYMASIQWWICRLARFHPVEAQRGHVRPGPRERLLVGDAGEAARARVGSVHYAATLAFVVFFFASFDEDARGIFEYSSPPQSGACVMPKKLSSMV